MIFRTTLLALLIGSTAAAQVPPGELDSLRAEMEAALGGAPAASPAALSPAQMTGIEFPVSRWHPELLERLFGGPDFLDPATDYEVPPPPANESVETQRELVDLLLLQKDARGSRDALYIQIEDRRGILPADLLYFHGMIPSLDDAPELWNLLDAVNEEALWFVLREKMRHSRARPSDLEPALRTMVPVPGHPAYPSGHATLYRAVFDVLGELIPECRESWREMASEIAHRREIAGLHFASDSEAGLALGEKIARDLIDGGHLDGLVEDLTRAISEREIAKPSCDPV